MKTLRHALVGPLTALAVALIVSPAEAANRAPTSNGIASANATAASTFATTTYADLPGATLAFTPVVDPNRVEAPGTPSVADTLLVEFNADVVKSTATTGTCAPFVNGAVVASFSRTVSSAAGQTVMTIIAPIANSTTGSQTIKIQCKSGDTNTFTVNTGVLRVSESF